MDAKRIARPGSRSGGVQTARAAVLLVLLSLLVGCAPPTLRRDWSKYEGPGAAAFHQENVPPPNFPDPLEPVNRGFWGLNNILIVGIAQPVGMVYRAVIPSFVRDRISDFSANLVFPRNFLANVVQGRWNGAGREIQRFAINTTVGLAGLWDPATQWFGIQPALQDFGQVFARWGWQPATYLTLPVIGPSSTRDTVGLVPDAALDPATYFFPAGPALTYNDLVDSIEDYYRREQSSADFYDDARLVSTIARDARIAEPELEKRGEQTGATDTLRAVFLAPRDPGFVDSLATGEVPMPVTRKMLPYSYRMQPGRAPMVFVVPGLSAHRLGNSTLALAEMAYARGFSVAIVSSTLNFEFIEQAGSVPVPGHAPVDAHDVHVALDGIARDLAAQYPDRMAERVYMGYSLGAFHGFYIAADEKRNPQSGLVRFDRYVLLDPPVRLVYGMGRLDAFNNVFVSLPPAEREAEIRRVLFQAVQVGQKLHTTPNRGAYTRTDAVDVRHSTLEPEIVLPFTNQEAEYLIGLAFRRALQAVLWTTQQREDQGVLLTERRPLQRLPAYEEIGDYSFTMYMYGFVLPYYRDRLGTVTSGEDLLAKNELRWIADGLRGNPKLRVFANRNDFLTSDEDIEWLTAEVGPERTRFFPTGGHVGNLYQPEVQAEVMASLADLVPRPEADTPAAGGAAR
jgi:ABC-type transporter lipoprotein component MlaA